MKILKLSIILFLTIQINAFADCNVSNEKSVIFSNSQTPDKFIVRISKDDCNSATQYIQIYTSNNELLYEHVSALSDGFRENIFLENAKYVTKLTFKDDFLSTTAKLPKWEPNEEYYEHHVQEIDVSKDYYEMLRTKDWPTFTHQSGYEGFLTIVYDRDKKKVVVVTSGSANKSFKRDLAKTAPNPLIQPL